MIGPFCGARPSGSVDNSRGALHFANTAKAVTMRPVLNEVRGEQAYICRMEAEIQELRRRLVRLQLLRVKPLERRGAGCCNWAAAVTRELHCDVLCCAAQQDRLDRPERSGAKRLLAEKVAELRAKEEQVRWRAGAAGSSGGGGAVG